MPRRGQVEDDSDTQSAEAQDGQSEGVQSFVVPKKPTRVSVVLSTDMKNSVIVEAETPTEVDELLPWAKELYAGLLEEFGVKTYGSQRGPSAPKAATPRAGARPAARAAATDGPVCADCGNVIQGFTDKDGKENTADQVAGWGMNKHNRPLCAGFQGSCYSKANAAGGGQARGNFRGGPRQGGYAPRAAAAPRRAAPQRQYDDLEDLPF